MIKPTVGRVVWVRDPSKQIEQQPEVGIITYVHSDEKINIAGFDMWGNPFLLNSVPLYQGEGPRPDISYCEWMPYQIGQAKAQTQV